MLLGLVLKSMFEIEIPMVLSVVLWVDVIPK